MRRERSTDGRAVLRFPGGLQIREANLVAGLILALVFTLLAATSAGVGTTDISLTDLFSHFLFQTPLDETQTYALLNVRLPRILLGFMAGWSVALAGAMLQSLARNPLADPGLFGLSQGAMTAVMLLVIFFPGLPKLLVAPVAVAGGLAVALLLILLVGRERTSGLAMLLMGIAIESMLSALASILLLYTPAETSIALADWLAGSLFHANWQLIGLFLPLFGLSAAGLFLIGRALAAYDLGNEMALALGEPVGRSRPLILGFAVVLSSASVTAVGPLTFLGVLAPHLAGFLSPSSGRARLVLSGLTGGILVVSADMLTRSFGTSLPLPIGLALTLVGVPLFILALRLQALRRINMH